MDAWLMGLILIVVVTAAILSGFFLLYEPGINNNTDNSTYNTTQSCQTDSDCVPGQCCHPTSCVNTAYGPNCEGIACTMICMGPIDCGAGSCRCISNRCQVVPSGY